MANSIYAPHFQGYDGDVGYLSKLQPRMIKVMDQPKREVVEELRGLVPGVILWAREYIFEGDLEKRIKQNPRQAAEFTLQRLAPYFNVGYDVGSLQNEILVFDPDGLKLIDEYHLNVMDLCPKDKSMAIGHINVGHPFLPNEFPNTPLGGYSLLSDSIDMCQAQGHIFSIHAYGRPENFWHKSEWLLSRFETIFMDSVFKKWPGLLMTYGEIGTSDRLDKQGGRHGGHRWAHTDERMAEDFIRHGTFLTEWSNHLVSAHTFTNNAFSPFEKSEMQEVLKTLANHYGNKPQNLKPLVNQPGTEYIPDTGGEIPVDTPLVHTIWKTKTGLNFRTEAKVGNNKIRVLASGEEVVVLAISGLDSDWYRVRDMQESVEGYVHGAHITYVRDIEPVETSIEHDVKELQIAMASVNTTIEALNIAVEQLGETFAIVGKDLAEAIATAFERIEALENDVIVIPPDPDFERNLSDGFKALRLSIIDPGTPIKYKLKIGFTTHDGSFEYEKPGTIYHVNQQNRDRVLLEWNNPQNYQGAGADTHIHVAMVNKDGSIIRPLNHDQHIKIWWDGHPKGRHGSWKILDHNNGFENWPMGDKKYFPNDGEQGIYKIAMVAPDGTEISEEIHGMGLPDGWHVSVFLLFEEI